MSNDKLKLGIALLVGLVVGLGFGTLKPQNTLGGQTGDNFATRGNLSASGTLTVAGATDLQAAITATGITMTGDTRVAGFAKTGLTALGTAATTSITAANVCDNATLSRNPQVATASTTLPTATALAADCMTANGDVVEFTLINISTTAASSSVFKAADASTTIRLVSTVAATTTQTVAGLGAATVRIVRTAADTNTVLISNFLAP